MLNAAASIFVLYFASSLSSAGATDEWWPGADTAFYRVELAPPYIWIISDWSGAQQTITSLSGATCTIGGIRLQPPNGLMEEWLSMVATSAASTSVSLGVYGACDQAGALIRGSKITLEYGAGN